MKVAIVGCGTMGSAFARSLSRKNEIFLVSKDPKKGLSLSRELSCPMLSLKEGLAKAQIILLAVKPRDLPELSKQMAPLITSEHIIISILAGITTASLQKHFSAKICIRCMPSLPIVCAQGILGIVDISEESIKAHITDLFGDFAFLYFLDEKNMDAFTAVCGSSPAFILLILEAMMEGAVKLGFSFADASELTLKSFEGTLALLRASKKHPASLKMDITSPAGTTIEGLFAMEEHGIRSALISTLVACCQRAHQMGKDLA